MCHELNNNVDSYSEKTNALVFFKPIVNICSYVKYLQKNCSVRKKVLCYFTDKKEKKIFLIYKEIQKSFMTNGLLIYMGKYLHLPHILGGPSSHKV